ncbi:hypothetical protein MBLNU13_g04043t1 [Cladosporium sp. NU13]
MSAPPPCDLADVDHVTFANLERHDRRVRVCPDWRKENVISNGLVRLSNEVHPAFEASRFIGPRFDIQDTQQARRFASHLLEADCSIPFWWALMSDCNDRNPRPRDIEADAANAQMFAAEQARMTAQEIEIVARKLQARDPSDVLYLRDPPPSSAAPTPLTPQQIAQTKAELRQLAQQVHYLVEVDADGSRCHTDWFSRATPPFRGSPSIIMISAKELRVHSDAMEGDLICQTWASVSLGFKLLQLLAHAAVAAARPGPRCYWNNQYRFNAKPKTGAEIRMLESCTFGGVLRREQEQEQVAKSHYTINGAEGVPGLWFAFSDFPGEDIEALYGTIDYDRDLLDYMPGENGPSYHREWQVSFSWLLSLLTDTFWNNHVRTRGQMALMPPKEVGYVMHRDGKRKYGPLHSAYIRRRGIVPKGYRMLPRSYVMARKDLQHDRRGDMLFGGYDVGRIVLDSDDEMLDDAGQSSSEPEGNGSGGSGPSMTVSDIDGSGDDGGNDMDID